MILVTLGTHELPFTRLLQEVERCKQTVLQSEDIIVQAGHTAYSSNYMQIHRFFHFDEMEALYEKADLLITHAGTGSVISGLRKNKVVIAAPRLHKFGEHNDDHQLQLVDVFEAAGHILAFREGDRLENIIAQAYQFEPTMFHSGRDRMFGLLNEFINEA
ncbi:PssE/Cps14G family polysaccharide biosynthesis glycosyltransferase [Gracilibacillus alcaliphilus]|uniref:PssE/Cps14G family polysaccharide biosynthesis glycosyltransferase n=1 Tax=Gracilibacillus alcaliphilus TaxID=1401441 RepID=UPI00195F034A|nr:PssE/Cps14G family polysaccharide biosynthesis glycosyltransferase [Gracilibacillus alcaliphilus]MBM7678409.1 UDP-N-acetylglucosamine transferase subunit ALG13 [Gracilibacillus alcaliphilus]